MSCIKKCLWFFSFVITASTCFFLPVVQGADVCSEGTGLPPFLSSGADPNLLLILDNSGSMLDMAYTDKQTYTATSGEYQYQNTCLDKGYLKEQDEQDQWVVNGEKEYAGYFDKDTWYKWEEPLAWQTGTSYASDTIVSSSGKLYKATCAAGGCTSTGISLDNDTGLEWEELNKDTVDEWTGTTAYSVGAMVIYQGMIFKANAGVAAGAETLFDNRNSSKELAWDRLDEGYFSPTTAAPCVAPTYTYTYTSGGVNAVERLELQIAFDSADTPTAVTCFAARGNILNWATASKLDIQKKILTGGKFYAGNEKWDVSGKVDNTVTTDSADDRLVAEHRGCSGKGFGKEIPLNRNSAGTTIDKKLVLKVRGPEEEIDRLDAADFTSRIEILGITDGIGIDYAKCAEYIHLVESGSSANNAMEEALEGCMYGTKPVQPVANIYHSALQDCWKIGKGDAPTHSGNLRSQCSALYTGGSHGGDVYPQQYPWEISPWDPHYICYGLWNDADPPSATNNYDGEGYVGRCWKDWPLSSGGEVCRQKTCNGLDGSGWVAKTTGHTTVYYKNENGVGQQCDGSLQYKCEDGGSVNTSGNPQCSGNGEKFMRIYVEDDDNETSCNPDSAGGVTADPTCSEVNATCWGFGPPGGDPCVEQAERDYCRDLNVPEVIDPSDLPTSSDGAVWGIGAAIIDAGIYGQMGVEEPLMVMKGYVKYQLPAEQTTDKVERPDGPRGVLFDTAGDLRVGAMAFKDNGSKTECDYFNATCSSRNPDGSFVVCDNQNSEACEYCTARQSIGNYCSLTDNHDGAEVITQIEKGMYVDDNGSPADFDDDKEVWDHYKLLVEDINDIRATSWTPLAEAMYNALGYYGQKTDHRLEAEDFYTNLETTSWPDPWPDPVEYWCQDNHVLIITEGSSTADIHPTVANFVTAGTFDSDTEIGTCTDGLEGSSYLDDLSWFGAHATVTGNAANASNLYATLLETHKDDPQFAKQPITTHVVTTGSLGTVGTECSPRTLMTNTAENGGSELLSGEDPAQLENNLKAVLSSILGRASAGSAASVISSSRSGEGAVYQAVFWPQDPRGINKDPRTWIGDVHGLFIDDQGRMWDDYDQNAILWSEDSDGDGDLDDGEDLDPDGTGPGVPNGCLDGDRRVFFFYDGENSKICFNESAWTTGSCDETLTDYCGSFTEPVPIKEFQHYLWSAKNELEDTEPTYQVTKTTANRTVDASGRWVWDTSLPTRYIFTWNDLNNNGIVDGTGAAVGEIIPIDDSAGWAAKSTTHHSILDDFKVADVTEMEHLSDWLRGHDWHEDANGNGVFDPGEDTNNNGVFDYLYRCRKADCDVAATADSDNPEWRLGDVVHSTPKLVAQPAEAFHTIYRDGSYAKFVKRYRYRRNVIYFGANDGMLHAVNGGFYNEEDNKFFKNMTLNSITKSPEYSDSGPDLGTEIWAYIPYNLQPHLKCLTDPLYGGGSGSSHKYFVDKEPRIFDMQIFTEEAECSDPYSDNCIHPDGWGTILVGAMRFGGAPITAATDGGWSVSDNREFVSSYFILDITDPERPPKLLGEMTRTTELNGAVSKYADLGFSVPMPSGVVMREALNETTSKTTWYLVFGNGPTSLKGENTQQGMVAILPLELDSASGVLKNGFRILNAAPTASASGVINFKLADTTTDTAIRFVSDMMTVDYDLEAQTDPNLGALYKSDAVYFGTVDGVGFVDDSVTGLPKWSGGGGVYRLVTREISGGTQVVTTPEDWYISKLIDTKAPVTGGLSVGWDLADFWIYAGTGRFFAADDKTDPTVNRFFGVKEPLNSSCEMTWGEINWSSGSLSPGLSAGSRGLYRTDNIQVADEDYLTIDGNQVIFCPSGSSTNLNDLNYCSLSVLGSPLGTTSYYSFADLLEYIAGEGRSTASSCPQANTSIGIDGWYRVLQDERERVIGQSALLGGLTTFTSYQPYDDICIAEGVSSLYGVYYQTGTAWYENVFGTDTRDSVRVVKDKLSLGSGLATTPSMHSGGSGSDAKAFVQSSTGEIIEIEQENLPIKPPKSGKMNWCDDCN